MLETLLGHQLNANGVKPATKHEELYKAHEKYIGEKPSAMEKFFYGWLTIGQIEAKLLEFANLEELRQAKH